MDYDLYGKVFLSGAFWEYVKDKRVKSGFIAKQVFNVQLNSKESVDALQQEFTLLPFVESAETSARLKNADSLEVETIKGACKKAMERADEYAHSVGTKAGKAFMVEGMSGVNEFNSSDSVGVYASMKVSMGISGKKSPEKSYIKVYQSESQKFVADKFLVTAEISVDGKDKEPLYKTIAEKRVALETLAKDLGVAASEIECLSLSIGKKSEWAMRQPENAGKPFKASQKIQVSFLSKEAAVAYFTALAHFENVMTESPAPTLINKDSLRVQVTRDAGKKALALARALAEGFGGKMGDVVRVGDSSSEGDDIQRSMALDDAVYEVSFEPVGKAGLAGLLGGGGSSMMNIADSVEIHSF
ncbi:MAG: SIMPL domain-containing protein, partial [Holdemanella sp.]|nr:SIMPL domain-containing protein [Holdemanella sp.]